MPINLDDSLAWTTASFEEQAMLADLQGNILKGHGRHATLNLFITLGDDRTLNRLMMRKLGALTTSALDQLHLAETHKALKAKGRSAGDTPPFVSVLLSHAGYAKLGIAAPGDAAFTGGMEAGAKDLGDDRHQVDPEWRSSPDVMVLIAADPDGDDAWQSSMLGPVEAAVANIVIGMDGKIAHAQEGRAIFRRQKNGSTEGIEHFGYVDGRSQPLLLKEDVRKEDRDHWDPDFPLKQVLVPDPAGNDLAFGSYFVFRKLEQNVESFKEAEEKLGEQKDRNGKPLGELAGAMLVGRFEDGTPVTLHGREIGLAPVPNDFIYDGDMEGARCPFHAHIRKTNPRGDAVRLGVLREEKDERGVIMARRGITYGRRDATIDPTDRPTRGVGLLFMSYQSSIVGQFQVTQQTWANNPGFVRAARPDETPPVPATGADPVIGQPPTDLELPRGWNDADLGTDRGPFGGHVTFRGGEYFFAPARSTLLGM